ncbi:hypothetical protein H632_c4279p0, partial [Helicosporidium sp. ATCC 50920]
MGGTLSVEERVYTLSKRNDYNALSNLLAQIDRTDPTRKDRYLNCTMQGGNTPLIVASQKGCLQCVDLLIRYGADVQRIGRSPNGGGALHEAVEHSHAGVIDRLMRAGANPFVENVKGFTAMDVACARRNVALLRTMERAAPWS